MVRKRLVIHGRVQGVFYRASTQEKAREIGVAGWVRNRPDGTVEAVVEGSPDAVTRLVEWCRKGPPHARVDEIDIRDETPQGMVPPFSARY